MISGAKMASMLHRRERAAVLSDTQNEKKGSQSCLPSQQNEQCAYAPHAAMACFFYCKALGIADRYGVWECLLYLMNMFHNHGVNHLNIANVLSASYYLQLKRVAKLLNPRVASDRNPQNSGIANESSASGVKESSTAFNASESTKEQYSDASARNTKEFKRILEVVQTSSFLKECSQSSNIAKRIGQRKFPSSDSKTKLHTAGCNTPSSNINTPCSEYENEKCQESLSRYHPSTPVHELDDSRLIWIIFVSSWLGFIWLEDIKIPLIHWCDVLRIVPLSEAEQENVNKRGFQQHFIDEVFLFWNDLDCQLSISQNELDETYMQMLGLKDAIDSQYL